MDTRVTRTAADIDSENVSDSSPKNTLATSIPEGFEAKESNSKEHLVNVPTAHKLRVASDTGMEELYKGFPGLENVSSAEKSSAEALFNNFLDGYGVVSNAGSVRSAAMRGGGHSINPVNIAVNAVSQKAPIAGMAVGSVLAGAQIANSAVGAVNSTLHIIERLDVLKSKRALLALPENYVFPSKSTLATEINDSQHSVLGVHELLYGALSLAEENEQKRIARASLNALGNSVSAVGGSMAIAGSAGAGIGAMPGLIVGAVGAGISLSTTAWQLFNYTVKRVTGTLGANREAAAKLIWGLALLHNSFKLEHETMNSPEMSAGKAVELATAVQNRKLAGTNKQKQVAQETAAKYWKDLAERWKRQMGEELSISDPRAGQAIFSDLGSVPSS